MPEKSDMTNRNPSDVQAWLIGGGIASLAASVHLIQDARVPASNIHILDVHLGSEGGMNIFGDPKEGYFLPFECHPYFHGECTERLLSLVPSDKVSSRSLLDSIRWFEKSKRPLPQEVAITRGVKRGKKGPEAVRMRGIRLGQEHRIDLIRFLLESESAIGPKSINQVLDLSFFETEFWTLWSTIFALQPWHSAIEFHRHLRKYLDNIQSLNNVKTLNWTRYNLYESIILPITTYLKSEGVDFRFHVEVTDLQTYPDGDPTTISEIHLLKDGHEYLITLDPEDICIVTLGSTSCGAVLGTNNSSPPCLSSNWEELMISEWGLWHKLTRKSSKFGDPANFISQAVPSGVETFTTTVWGPEFIRLYENLTHDRPGTGALLSLTESNWSIALSIPHQPVFSNQPEETSIIFGFAQNPASEGNYVKKVMYQCSGLEIFQEVLSHLDFTQSILETATTIPCGMPLGTAPFVTRGKRDRPQVIPPETTNIACIGQFVEVPEETTLNMEYSVRGAQLAVSHLMGLSHTPGKVKKNVLWEVFDEMK